MPSVSGSAAVVNAVWDLWARTENKPLWRLLCDMPAEELVGCIDFRYITDALTASEACELLRGMEPGRAERKETVCAEGYPAYTTSVGWLGYSDTKLRELCRSAVAGGWSAFKLKVGRDLGRDMRRLTIVREEIGEESAPLPAPA